RLPYPQAGPAGHRAAREDERGGKVRPTRSKNGWAFKSPALGLRRRRRWRWRIEVVDQAEQHRVRLILAAQVDRADVVADLAGIEVAILQPDVEILRDGFAHPADQLPGEPAVLDLEAA